MRGGRPAPRELLHRMAAEPAPEPRAVFVAQLEDRLAELIRRSADGDLVPEIELSVPAVPKAPRRAAAGVTSVLAALVVLLAPLAVVRDPTPSGAGLAIAGNDARRPVRDPAAATEPRSPRPRDGAVAAQPDGGLPEGSVPRRGIAPLGPCDGLACAGAAGGGTGPPSPQRRADGWPSGPEGPGAAPPELAAGPASREPLGPSSDEVAVGPTGPARLDLRVAGSPALVSLEWSRYDGEDFAAYVVLRADGGEPADVGALDATLLLLRVENREMTNHLDLPRLGSPPRYQLVAVRRDGSIAAESAVVSAAALPPDVRPGSAYPAIS